MVMKEKKSIKEKDTLGSCMLEIKKVQNEEPQGRKVQKRRQEEQNDQHNIVPTKKKNKV